jgi:hypothetical protein
MKKLLFLVVFVGLLIFSCDNDTVDFYLPKTDTSLYISGNIVTFPKGTKAIDVYNTAISIFEDNEYHDISNGEWKYINTTNTNGLINQSWETVNFGKVKHTLIKTKTHPNNSGDVHTHSVFLYTNDSSIKEIVYQWEPFNGNTQKVELKNEAIEGDITFTF